LTIPSSSGDWSHPASSPADRDGLKLILFPPDEVKKLLVSELQARLPMFAGMARGPAEKVVDALYARGICVAIVQSPELLQEAKSAFARGQRVGL
jgi:hypothetical protein